MAKDQTKRINPSILQADLDAFSALLAITDYRPINEDYSVDIGQRIKDRMLGNQTTEVQSKAKYEADKDASVESEWELHNYVLGVKDQIKAQFGADSSQIQALGLKKKSEYKTSKRKTSTSPQKPE